MQSYNTPLGELKIELFGHAAVHFTIKGKNWYLDPYCDVCSFEGKTPADFILITHDHYDHYDEEALVHIVQDHTILVIPPVVPRKHYNYQVLQNGESCTLDDVKITAVPAYNIHNLNDQDQPLHPEGVGNGYILDLGGFKIYFAGDTEFIPFMKTLKEIDIAFLPKNLPYTMPDAEFVRAANTIKPAVLYPYHYFELNPKALRAEIDPQIKMVMNDHEY